MFDKILVTRSSMPELDEYINEIKELWNTHWLTNMGEKHQCFQKELLEYLEVSNVDLVTNGHMALELSLQAMGFEKGSEVITTPFTFASTIHAIVRNGLVPVFCDINPIDFTIDVNKIERLITKKTCAILPVHVYGSVCDIEKIDVIAELYNLKVIYDAAHAFGVKYNEKGIGSYGDVSCFSFHATKVFNTIEGGAVCFKKAEFGNKLYGLKNFGIRNEENVDAVGANAKMNEFCAAMGICNLRNIHLEINKRKNIVEHYCKHFENVPGVQLKPIQSNVKSNYAYFPVVFSEEFFKKNRNEVYEQLKKNNIFTRKYFYPIASMFDCYKGSYEKYPTPIAYDISRRVLVLPLYADLSMENVDRICDIVLS